MPHQQPLAVAQDALALVTVIVVTYNSRAILRETLPRLVHLPHLVVVDNASSDDTVATVRSLAPLASIVEAGANLGFGRANNLALERVVTPYALLLNPYCFLHDGAIPALVAAARRYPDAAILAPKLYDAPGVLGLCYRPPFWAAQPKQLIDPEGDLCSEFLTGAAMLLDMAKMRAGVGFFDPWYFLYLEDDDLCLRVRRAGHSLVLVHDAEVEHHVRSSSPPSRRLDWRRDYAMTLSKFYLQRKTFGNARCLAAIARIGLGALLAMPVHALRLDARRFARSAARLAAALAAPVRLGARHSIASSSVRPSDTG
jgi:N-acetylglucosaminyl-diphospho-decaprenol L-rhamnosyltransferase